MLLAGDFDLTWPTLSLAAHRHRHRVTAARDNVTHRARRSPCLRSFCRSGRSARRRSAPRDRLRLRRHFRQRRNDANIERGQFFVRNIVGASEEHGVIAVGSPARANRRHHRPRPARRRTIPPGPESNPRRAEQSRVKYAPPAFGLYFDCVSRGAGLYKFPVTTPPTSGQRSAHPDRWLLHRLRNRPARRGDMRPPIFRRPRDDRRKVLVAVGPEFASVVPMNLELSLRGRACAIGAARGAVTEVSLRTSVLKLRVSEHPGSRLRVREHRACLQAHPNTLISGAGCEAASIPAQDSESASIGLACKPVPGARLRASRLKTPSPRA